MEFKPFDIADIRDNLLNGKIARVRYRNFNNGGGLSYDKLYAFSIATTVSETTGDDYFNLRVFHTLDDVVDASAIFYPHDEYARHFGFWFESHNQEGLSYSIIEGIDIINLVYDNNGNQEPTTFGLIKYTRDWYEISGDKTETNDELDWVSRNQHLL